MTLILHGLGILYEVNIDLLSTCRIASSYSHVKILYLIWGCSFTYKEALHSVTSLFLNRKGKSDMVIYQYAVFFFCFKKANFVKNNFTKFLIAVLTHPTCQFNLYCTSYNIPDIDSSVADWVRRWTFPLHARRVLYAGSIPPCGIFSWFCYSFIICTNFWNAFCFNIMIQTF